MSMIAQDLISESLPPLQTSDKGDYAIDLMADYQVKHLPIVNNSQFHGLISQDDMLGGGLINKSVGNQDLTFQRPFVLAHDHLYQVLKVCATLHLSVIPVVDQYNNYKGVITQERLLEQFASSNSISEPGGIIVLEVAVRNYSLAEICRIVEENNATILSLLTAGHSDSAKREITVKVNTEILAQIVASFERHDYQVLGSFQEAESAKNLKNNYDSLIRYLNP